MKHANTKYMRSNYAWYKAVLSREGCRTLDGVYTSYSAAKARAYRYCKDLEEEYNGEYGSVIGHNCMVFTYAFIGEYDGKSAFFYITCDYDRFIYLDEVE